MLNQRRSKNNVRIAVVGNYLPRQCGIATFTSDLSKAISSELSVEDNLINVAMDDIAEGYDYPSAVKFRVRQDVQSDYYWAADYLNANRYDAVILQHEFGIFGGESGEYVVDMIKYLKMPVITTLHTVLEHPSDSQMKVMKELEKYSDNFVVMSKKAISILTSVYGIDKDMINFIPHGIPDSSFKNAGVYNTNFGFKNRDVILTFGLLGPGKGLECMIEAMPMIVKENPKALYVILGQTHPHVLNHTGDEYRRNLQLLVNKLKMDNHVVFHNNFVKIETLVQYLQTSKIYAIPYLKKEQITSGTLAYAMGVGVPVVSTPFWHAEELLDEGRGVLTPFNDSKSMALAINNLLANDHEREIMRLKGYQYGRSMIWKEVSKQYLELISEIKERKPFECVKADNVSFSRMEELPEINLMHLKNLMDGTGLLQHAKYSTPNFYHGYCTDDNARALIALTRYFSLKNESDVIPYMHRSLAFLYYAFNEENGRFRNFMSYDRRWMELTGSEDSHARALWGLGVTVKEAPDCSIRNMAMNLFSDALAASEHFYSPRAWAYTVLGLQSYLAVYGGDLSARKIRDKLAKKIFKLFKDNATQDWPWCEVSATYANAILPHAMIMAAKWIPNSEMFEMGIKALSWLLKIQTAPDGHLSVIGNKGWLNKDGTRAMFDQQPIEIKGLVDACVDCYYETGDKKWLNEAERCTSWFVGNNDLGIPLYNEKTGGCSDGLEKQGINSNQGAESTLACLISLIDLHSVMNFRAYFEDGKKQEIFNRNIF